jgi:mono/diheme cytochrome c family protein
MKNPNDVCFRCLLALGLWLTTGATYSLAQAAHPIHAHGVEGAEIFKNHCATCHGSDARGHGPTASALKTAVPDLTQISARNGGKFPAEQMKKLIAGEAPAAHGTREMPVWGPIFHEIDNDRDLGNVRLEAITKYLESLQKK